MHWALALPPMALVGPQTQQTGGQQAPVIPLSQFPQCWDYRPCIKTYWHGCWDPDLGPRVHAASSLTLAPPLQALSDSFSSHFFFLSVNMYFYFPYDLKFYKLFKGKAQFQPVFYVYSDTKVTSAHFFTVFFWFLINFFYKVMLICAYASVSKNVSHV